MPVGLVFTNLYTFILYNAVTMPKVYVYADMLIRFIRCPDVVRE